MTLPKSPRIDLNPGRTQRLDFDSFVHMNLPGKRAANLRMAFKLIWIAHQIYPAQYNRKALRIAHYIHLKEDIEEKLSKERGKEVKLDLPRTTIEKTLRYMRKAGYLRYVPLEDLWYFSGRAASALKKLAKNIEEEFQTTALDKDHADRIIHDFSFGLEDSKTTKKP